MGKVQAALVFPVAFVPHAAQRPQISQRGGLPADVQAKHKDAAAALPALQQSSQLRRQRESAPSSYSPLPTAFPRAGQAKAPSFSYGSGRRRLRRPARSDDRPQWPDANPTLPTLSDMPSSAYHAHLRGRENRYLTTEHPLDRRSAPWPGRDPFSALIASLVEAPAPPTHGNGNGNGNGGDAGRQADKRHQRRRKRRPVGVNKRFNDMPYMLGGDGKTFWAPSGPADKHGMPIGKLGQVPEHGQGNIPGLREKMVKTVIDATLKATMFAWLSSNFSAASFP